MNMLAMNLFMNTMMDIVLQKTISSVVRKGVLNMLDIINLYAYRIEELAVGIVKAESYEDAREKVKAAYLKHNDCFDSERDFIELKEITENDSWFSDNSDVVEVDELI